MNIDTTLQWLQFEQRRQFKLLQGTCLHAVLEEAHSALKKKKKHSTIDQIRLATDKKLLKKALVPDKVIDELSKLEQHVEG